MKIKTVSSFWVGFLLFGCVRCSSETFTSTDVCREVKTEYGTALEAIHETEPCTWSLGLTLKRKDYIIHQDVRPLRGPLDRGSGILFGLSHHENSFDTFLIFMVTGNGNFKLMQYDGEWRSLIDWSFDPTIRQGYLQHNDLAVEIHGNTILCYVNGKYMSGYQFPLEIGGGIGQFVDYPGSQTLFGEMNVSEIQSSDKKPVPGRVLYEDDMITRHVLLEAELGTCRAQYGPDGYYVTNIAASGFCKILIPWAGNLTPPFRIELDVTLVEGMLTAAAGFTFAQTNAFDNNTFSMYGANGQIELQLSRRENGKWSMLLPWYRDQSRVNRGYTTNRLVIEARGQTMHCFINGYPVQDAYSPADGTGYISLYLDQPGMKAIFSYLRITQL